jgi:hypothetical protein
LAVGSGQWGFGWREILSFVGVHFAILYGRMQFVPTKRQDGQSLEKMTLFELNSDSKNTK